MTDSPYVFLALPWYGSRPGECAENWQDSWTAPTRVTYHPSGQAGTARNFSMQWCRALNMRDRGLTHFAMIHSDVLPLARKWLDVLLAEQEHVGADVLSVVLPIKSYEGYSSTAIADPEGNWRRLTMRELDRIPEVTFDADAAGFPGWRLLTSTGLWICDFTRRWVEGVHWEARTRIIRNRDGVFETEFSEEDWTFAHQLHDHGLKVAATRIVPCSHYGMCPHPNTGAWGTVESDQWHPAPPWEHWK